MPRGKKTSTERHFSKQAVAPPNSPYGAQKDTHDATAAVPLPNNARTQQVDMASVLAAAQQHAPPNLSMAAPTANPAEPSTAGLPVGAGPGPSPDAQTGDPTLDLLQELYRSHPTPDLLRLIEVAQMENRTSLQTGGKIGSPVMILKDAGHDPHDPGPLDRGGVPFSHGGTTLQHAPSFPSGSVVPPGTAGGVENTPGRGTSSGVT